jgi:hypothetical protein
VKGSRKYLSAKGLLSITRSLFNKIKSPRELAPRANSITQTDCLMSAVAMFSLKFPSLLKFDENKEEKNIKHNLLKMKFNSCSQDRVHILR